MSHPRVIIIGAGFAGLRAAKVLNGSDCDVIVFDKKNHHLFQPLLYQVAMSALSPGDIAAPIRTELRDSPNIKVYFDQVIGIDRKAKRVKSIEGEYEYDYLILAVGAVPNYFGNESWRENAPGLKTLNDALEIRERILRSFEQADKAKTKEEFDRCCTFVIIGGGPTGVELAGSLREVALRTIIPDFSKIKIEDINIFLIDGGKRLLSSYPEDLSEYTKKTLEKIGVKVLTGEKVEEISDVKVRTNKRDISTECVIWAAGNKSADIINELNADTDRAGRVLVEADYSIKGDPNVFVVGDAAYLKDANGEEVPGIAPAANQSGEYVAKLIKNQVPIAKRKPFEYLDKGQMATIGRAKAVGLIGKKTKVKGLLAWLMWGGIHVFYLIDFRNRIKVLLEWFWFYITYKPGAQLILREKQKKGA
jgi:NADH dehydrogenase